MKEMNECRITDLTECPEIYLCHSENCLTCSVMERVLEDYITSGKVKLLDVYSDEGEELLEGTGISAVPSFLVGGILSSYAIEGNSGILDGCRLMISGESRNGCVDLLLNITD